MPPRSKTTASRRSPPKRRGATGRSAGQRGGAPINNNAARNNLLLGFIAGLLVGALAVALWYEKQPPPVAPLLTESTPKTTVKPVKETPSNPPPTAGSEFYEKLPAANVETFSEPKDNTPLTPYVLQTGAFRSRGEADQMEARIALEAGMEVWIDERVSSSGTRWYRVRLGPFKGKRATDRVKRQLWERARVEAVRYQHQVSK